MYTESAHWMSVAEDEGVELYYKYIYPHQEAYNVSIKDPYGVSVSPLATRGNNSIFTYNITNASVLTHEGLWEMSMCNTAGCASAFTFVFVRGRFNWPSKAPYGFGLSHFVDFSSYY